MDNITLLKAATFNASAVKVAITFFFDSFALNMLSALPFL